MDNGYRYGQPETCFPQDTAAEYTLAQEQLEAQIQVQAEQGITHQKMIEHAVNELTEYYENHPDWMGRVETFDNEDIAAFVKVHWSVEISTSEISDIRQKIKDSQDGGAFDPNDYGEWIGDILPSDPVNESWVE